jgi:antitoxin ParD1/3/4
MNVKIPPRFEELVKQKIDSGLYQSHEELIEKALTLLDEYDRKLADLREGIQIAVEEADNGELEPASEVFDRILKRNAGRST